MKRRGPFGIRAHEPAPTLLRHWIFLRRIAPNAALVRFPDVTSGKEGAEWKTEMKIREGGIVVTVEAGGQKKGEDEM